ncbi:RNA-directed DNA polymerase from mobile element jockey-like Protein [Trichonephila clavipes]|nr:RNA-directed DNA polymerase from mobile element jockey-like Protein [Trichonephila clavipes]
MAVTDPQKANLLANTIKNNFIENNRMQDNYDQDDEVVTSAVNTFFSLPPSTQIEPVMPDEIINFIKNTSSKKAPGCPQGSLLGPLLFNLYINDIPSYSLTNISLYADDTAINATYKNLKTVTFAINKHLKLLENYYDRWKISINVEKSCAVIFTKKRTIPPPSHNVQ